VIHAKIPVFRLNIPSPDFFTFDIETGKYSIPGHNPHMPAVSNGGRRCRVLLTVQLIATVYMAFPAYGSILPVNGYQEDFVSILDTADLKVFTAEHPLPGDALQGETQRLRARMRQLFDRLETQLRLILREWSVTRVPGPELGSAAAANLLLSAAEGRINQFVRSEFRALPTAGWEEQWKALERAVFR